VRHAGGAAALVRYFARGRCWRWRGTHGAG